MMANKEEISQLSLGQTLQRRRLEIGFTLETVAQTTRVPQRFLAAMESDCFEDLPGQPYAAGFVRNYARHLGLAENVILERFRNEAKPCRAEPVFCVTEPETEARLPSRSMVIGGLLLSIAAYSIWFSVNNISVPTDAFNAGTRELAALNADDVRTAPLRTASDFDGIQILSLEGTGGAGQSVAEQGVTDQGTSVVKNDRHELADGGKTTVPDALSLEVQAQETPVPNMVTADAGNKAQDDADALDRPVSAESVQDKDTVVVEVVEDAWVHITHGNDILYTGVMKAGRRYQPEFANGVELTTGNAGGVVLHFGDWSSGPLGRVGHVRRAVSLDPTSWQEQTLTQDRS